jgi:hypothetical protein
MADDLSAAELAALALVDGTHIQPPMAPEVEMRLRELFLIERREWPNGPMWRTARGKAIGALARKIRLAFQSLGFAFQFLGVRCQRFPIAVQRHH